MHSRTKLVLLILFLALSITLSFVISSDDLSAVISHFFENYSTSFALSIYFLLFFALTSISFPAFVLIAVGPLFFSLYHVILIAVLGLMISSIVQFYLARFLGKKYVSMRLTKYTHRQSIAHTILREHTFKTIFILSTLIFIPRVIPNFLGGVMRISSKKYILATACGVIPLMIFMTYFVYGFTYQDTSMIFGSVMGMIVMTLVSLYFSRGELLLFIRTILSTSSKFTPSSKSTK